MWISKQRFWRLLREAARSRTVALNRKMAELGLYIETLEERARIGVREMLRLERRVLQAEKLAEKRLKELTEERERNRLHEDALTSRFMTAVVRTYGIPARDVQAKREHGEQHPAQTVRQPRNEIERATLEMYVSEAEQFGGTKKEAEELFYATRDGQMGEIG